LRKLELVDMERDILDSNRSGGVQIKGDDLSGIGSQITPATVTRTVDILSGAFRILNPSNMKESMQ
jgi:hypothetical protein